MKAEIVARKRAKLADGKWGWTAIAREAYRMDRTVVGFRKNFIDVPYSYKNGTVGSDGEREYAKHVSSAEIEREY